MKQFTPKAKRQFRIFLMLYMLVILMSLLTVASYTWFSLSRTPRVSNMYMFINSVSGLEISDDPLAEEWQLQLDFREMVDVTTPLRPITWSNIRQQFYAARYGADGRLTDYMMWEPLNDDRHANQDNMDGYYIKATFYIRSGQSEKVFLSPAVEVDEGIDGHGTYVIGTPVWNGQEVFHYNGGQGAECAIRIGIRITPVDETGKPLTNETSEFFIYEPNSNLHADGTTGYVPTPSVDNTPTLIPQDHLILQTASTWAEAYPVQRDVVIRTLGEFETDVELFTLEPGQIKRIELYIWLEGQDIDCTNRIQEAQILASIQFASEREIQSGMVPIE